MNDSRDVQLRVTAAAVEYDANPRAEPGNPCPYLPGRYSRTEAYRVEELDPFLYERLLGCGFRRSGRIVYRPRCEDCRECRQLRVPVAGFSPSRSQRRVLRANADVSVRVQSPRATDEKYILFRAYLDRRHDEAMERSVEAFQDFLYDSPTATLEFEYRIGTRLVGVSIADRCFDGLSSVYMYYDPEMARRSPGTFSVLHEIQFTRSAGMSYYYLGYYVAGCSSMAYKARFRPCHILVENNRWLSLSP